ncbi:MAG TPA: DUF1761 domain-containing protein [Candidatus Paceibacterota bacterium]
MEVFINYWAVAIAAIASMFIGFVWYGPIFGKQWIALMGWREEQMNAMKTRGGMIKLYGLAFVGSLVMSYALAHTLVFSSTYLGVSGLSAGAMAGFWSWLGFVAPVTLGSVLWEGKSWKLWFLNNAYYTVSLVVMGSILGVW